VAEEAQKVIGPIIYVLCEHLVIDPDAREDDNKAPLHLVRYIDQIGASPVRILLERGSEQH
jgi:hypothetical protein